MDALIRAHADKLGIVRREISQDEIVARLFYPLINEGALILEEGIAQRPGDIDIVYVYGYAFPSAKGGPMFYADEVGLKTVYDTIVRFGRELGEEHWKPAPLLERLARSGSTFSEWDANR